MRKGIDPLVSAYWIIGQFIGRVAAEMDQDRVDLDKWNEASEGAILHHLFG